RRGPSTENHAKAFVPLDQMVATLTSKPTLISISGGCTDNGAPIDLTVTKGQLFAKSPDSRPVGAQLSPDFPRRAKYPAAASSEQPRRGWEARGISPSVRNDR